MQMDFALFSLKKHAFTGPRSQIENFGLLERLLGLGPEYLVALGFEGKGQEVADVDQYGFQRHDTLLEFEDLLVIHGFHGSRSAKFLRVIWRASFLSRVYSARHRLEQNSHSLPSSLRGSSMGALHNRQ